MGANLPRGLQRGSRTVWVVPSLKLLPPKKAKVLALKRQEGHFGDARTSLGNRELDSLKLNRIPRLPIFLPGIGEGIPDLAGKQGIPDSRFGREPGIGVPIRRAGDFLVWTALIFARASDQCLLQVESRIHCKCQRGGNVYKRQQC